jgi:Zn-dependent M16 (insulinase) family peptidase
LVKKTADFNTWNNEVTSDEVLKSLRAVDLKDISIEMKDREINETTIDGVKLWSTIADVDGISKIQVNIDLSHLTMEELSYLKFYLDMLSNGMDTEDRSELQVMNDVTNSLYSFSYSIEAVSDNKKDTSAHPILSISYYSFEDEYKDTFDLVYDILLQSDIANIETYGKRTITNLKSSYNMQFAEPFNIAQYRSMAYTSASYRIINYLNGLDYYKFILTLENELASNPTNIFYKLNETRAKVFNKGYMHVLYAGDSNGLDKFKKAMPDFTNKFTDISFGKKEYSLPRPAKREAMMINSPVQYLWVNASLSENDVPSSQKGLVISTVLNNLMLTPEIRLRGGAYGVGASFTDNNYIAYTYRDSNFVNSLNVIGATDEFLKTIIPYMTEETLESYIMSLFGSLNLSNGEINDALQVLVEEYYGLSIEDKIAILEEVKKTSSEDFEAYVDYLSRINENFNYIVVASPSEIKENKELFDEVITLD